MSAPIFPDALARLRSVARKHRALQLLVLLGSRARGDAGEHSDWDVGHVADDGLDAGLLAADLMSALRTDQFDLVDLRRASALLRRDAAGEGLLLHERQDGAFTAFRVEAAVTWCDMEAVLREAHADVLRAAAG